MGDIYHAGEVYAGSVPIDDTQASEETVYSSAKVETMIEEVQEELAGTIVNLDNDSNSRINGKLTKCMSGYMLYILSPKQAMTYNTAYSLGNLPFTCNSELYETYFKANNRDFKISIGANGTGTLMCLTNSLPSDGKPILGYTICFF